MQKSESIGKLAEALAKAQADFGPLVKGASNPFFKSKYSDLAAVMDVARGPLAENGLCLTQTTDDSPDGKLVVETTIIHISGEWITGRLAMPVPKSDPQGYGSAFTYARRYALQAILGLAAEDDDAESAMQRKDAPKGNGGKPPEPPKQEPQQSEPVDPNAFLQTLVIELAEALDEKALTALYKKYRKQIEAHPQQDKIVAEFATRKEQIKRDAE